MYTAYVLDNESRAALMERFPPKYQRIIGHHITVEFGIEEGTPPPDEHPISVIGYVDSEDGIETLVCSVDGSRRRPDNGTFHITWSLDPNKYKPKDSNELIRTKRFTLIRSIPIETTPEVLS